MAAGETGLGSGLRRQPAHTLHHLSRCSLSRNSPPPPPGPMGPMLLKHKGSSVHKLLTSFFLEFLSLAASAHAQLSDITHTHLSPQNNTLGRLRMLHLSRVKEGERLPQHSASASVCSWPRPRPQAAPGGPEPSRVALAGLEARVLLTLLWECTQQGATPNSLSSEPRSQP